MNKIKKILLTKFGKKFYLKDLDNDTHNQFGTISKDQLKKAKDGDKITSNTGKDFYLIPPSFIDSFKKIKRQPQIIPSKDIGLIITETGISKDSHVVDAGAGSGALACSLANIVKKVTTYEIREDFVEIVKKNIDFLNLKNITIKNKDINEGIEEKNIDLVTLDLPSPWLALDSASKALKPGAFLVSYSPTIPQVMDFVREIKQRDDFIFLTTKEISEREWEIEDRKVRPRSQQIGHSGFLTFVRKI
jgi:tRNA (adenine57-N1/adenine58-N1)-methyltransferase|tara:strand:- start:26754 stop:27494 length:741 start_codon:yes stop_codon:yes gene_type:complete